MQMGQALFFGDVPGGERPPPAKIAYGMLVAGRSGAKT